LAYETLYANETHFPEIHDRPIAVKSKLYGDWFNMQKYIEAENLIKENKGKVFSPHFDLRQVLPYDGNAKEHLIYLEKLCWLAEKEYVFFSTYSDIDKEYKKDKSFPCLLCSDTFGMAYADAELFDRSDIDLIIDMITKFGYKGIVAWVGKKRKQNPLFEYARIDPEEYAKAVEYLESKLS
jgi:hypothetical protein